MRKTVGEVAAWERGRCGKGLKAEAEGQNAVEKGKGMKESCNEGREEGGRDKGSKRKCMQYVESDRHGLPAG